MVAFPRKVHFFSLVLKEVGCETVEKNLGEILSFKGLMLVSPVK